MYRSNFIRTWNNHWYCFAFYSALLPSLIWISWRQESSFLPLIGISGLLTCQVLLVFHLCRFHNFKIFTIGIMIIIFDIIIIWSHFISFSAFFSNIFGHKRLNRGGGYGLGISVKYRFYGQEKIVQWLPKKIKTVKKCYSVKFLNVWNK